MVTQLITQNWEYVFIMCYHDVLDIACVCRVYLKTFLYLYCLIWRLVWFFLLIARNYLRSIINACQSLTTLWRVLIKRFELCIERLVISHCSPTSTCQNGIRRMKIHEYHEHTTNDSWLYACYYYRYQLSVIVFRPVGAGTIAVNIAYIHYMDDIMVTRPMGRFVRTNAAEKELLTF